MSSKIKRPTRFKEEGRLESVRTMLSVMFPPGALVPCAVTHHNSLSPYSAVAVWGTYGNHTMNVSDAVATSLGARLYVGGLMGGVHGGDGVWGFASPADVVAALAGSLYGDSTALDVKILD